MLRTVIALSLALAISIAGNVFQLYQQGHAAGKAAGEQTAADQLGAAVGEVKALRETAERAASVADGAAKEFADVASDVAAIAEASRKRQIVYVDKIKEVPAATCAPGVERMEAFNAALDGGP